MRFIRDAIAHSVDTQKAAADQRGQENYEKFALGDKVLLSTMVSILAPRNIGPFKVIKTIGNAYSLDIATTMQLHSTFYVGRFKRYHPALLLSLCATPWAHTEVIYDVTASADLKDESHAAPHCHDEEPRSTVTNAQDAALAQLSPPKHSRRASQHSPQHRVPDVRRINEVHELFHQA